MSHTVCRGLRIMLLLLSLTSVGTTALPARDEANYDRCFAQGKRAYDRRDFETAITFFTQCLDLKPSSADAYLRRGNALAEKKNPDRERAMNDYINAIALDPERAEFHFAKGVLHREMRDIDAALKEYTTAIDLKADYHPPRLNRGSLLVGQKRYQEAVEDLTKAISLNPKEQGGYYWRAYARHYLGDDARAVPDFEAAIKGGIKDARFHNDFAWILATSDEPGVRNAPRAIKLALKAIELNKTKNDLASLYDTLATAYDKNNQGELAKKYRALSLKAKEDTTP